MWLPRSNPLNWEPFDFAQGSPYLCVILRSLKLVLSLSKERNVPDLLLAGRQQ